MLDEIETRLTWRPSRGLPLLERFKKVGAGLLALKELQYLGHTQEGTIDERIPQADRRDLLKPMEAEWVNGNCRRAPRGAGQTTAGCDSAGHDQGRTQRSRNRPGGGGCWKMPTWRSSFTTIRPVTSPKSASKGRIIETVERFEEDLTGKVTVHGPVEAKVTVGDAIEVGTGREARGESDPLMTAIEGQLRTMLGIPAEMATP